MFLVCMAPVFVPIPAMSQDAADQEAKAKAEARAVEVGKAYETERANFDQALKDDKLEEAAKAAKAMIELSSEQGKPPWQPAIRTYSNVIQKFEEKKVFGSRHTRAFYEAALKTLEDGDVKADMTLSYGQFLYTYALVDDKEAIALINSAFDIPGVTDRKKMGLCERIAGHVAGRMRGRATPYLDIDRYTDMALAYAKDDPAAVTGISAWMVRSYGQLGREDEIIPLYEKFLADKVYENRHAGLGIEMVNYLNRNRDYAKALEYLNKAIPKLEGPDKLRYQRLLADTYVRSADRFYSDPDKEDILLAINVHRDILKQTPYGNAFDIADSRISIAELAHTIGDFETAADEARQALAVPELAEKRIAAKLKAEYILGRAAYDQGIYPEAVEILARAWAKMAGKNVSPHQVPYRRDLLEKLVRGYCAVGDIPKAIGLSGALLDLVADHERARYRIFIDGLQQRITAGR